MLKKAATHRLKRYIEAYGKTVHPYKQHLNEFNELRFKETEEFKGLYHRGQAPHIDTVTTDGGTKTEKTADFITALWESVEDLKIKDRMEFNGVLYEITGIYNLNQENSIGQLSLREVQV